MNEDINGNKMTLFSHSENLTHEVKVNCIFMKPLYGTVIHFTKIGLQNSCKFFAVNVDILCRLIT